MEEFQTLSGGDLSIQIRGSKDNLNFGFNMMG